MNKIIWALIESYDKAFITKCLESGVDGFVVKKQGIAPKIKELGIIKTIAEDGDLKLGEDVTEIIIKSKSDEIKAAQIGKSKYVIIDASDWKIIPIENLLAQCDNIISVVKNVEDAKTNLQILERGVAGVLIDTKDINTVMEICKFVKTDAERLNLVELSIELIKPVGLGDRVCVDTCSEFKIGQGMLVGNSSTGMFLVHAEVEESEYVASRPFRVNAGPVHAYTRVPGNKTRYLSEIKAGDEVMIYNEKGEGEIAVVGRSKVEKRPLMLVKAKYNDMKITHILQNAETIKLTNPEGKPVSIVKLKKGDIVLGYIEENARHFGMSIKETIKEK